MKHSLLLMVLFLSACDIQAPDVALLPGPIIQVSESGFGAFEVSLAKMESGQQEQVAVAWYDTRHGNGEIYLRLLDSDLQTVSDEIRISDTSAESYEADLVAAGNNLAIAWYEVDEQNRYSLTLRMLTRQGETLWQRRILHPASNLRIPLLRTTEDRLFLAWVEDPVDHGDTSSQIYAAWYNLEGEVVVERFLVGTASSTTWNLNGEFDHNGQMLLVYDSAHDSQASELYLAKINDTETSLNLLTGDDGWDSKYPDVAPGNQQVAFTWFDNQHGNNEVYLALINSGQLTDTTVGLESRSIRITESDGDSIGAYLAWHGNQLGLAWNDNESGNHEIYFQLFDDEANPLTDSTRLTHDQPDSLIPAIEALNNGFVLGWNSALLGDHEAAEDTTTSEIAVTQVQTD